MALFAFLTGFEVNRLFIFLAILPFVLSLDFISILASKMASTWLFLSGLRKKARRRNTMMAIGVVLRNSFILIGWFSIEN